MKKTWIYTAKTAVFFAVLFFIFIGQSIIRAQDELDELLKNVPDEIRSELPDGEISAELYGLDFIFGKAFEILKSVFPSSFSRFSEIFSVIFISSFFGLHFKDASGGRYSDIFSLISTLTIAVISLSSLSELIEKLKAVTASLTSFASASAPILSSIQMLSANTSGAAVSSYGFLFFSSATELAVSFVFVPLCEIFAAFSVISAVLPIYSGSVGVTSFLKKSFTFLLSAASMIYIAVLSYQTELAAAADSVVSRSIKFAVSNSIPIIGSAVGDAVRTALAGLSVIKSSAGVLGITVIILMTLPLLCELFLMSFFYGLSAFSAKLLGCERESFLLGELRSVTDFAVAVLSVSVTVFIITLAIFIKTTPALYV